MKLSAKASLRLDHKAGFRREGHNYRLTIERQFTEYHVKAIAERSNCVRKQVTIIGGPKIDVHFSCSINKYIHWKVSQTNFHKIEIQLSEGVIHVDVYYSQSETWDNFPRPEQRYRGQPSLSSDNNYICR